MCTKYQQAANNQFVSDTGTIMTINRIKICCSIMYPSGYVPVQGSADNTHVLEMSM